MIFVDTDTLLDLAWNREPYSFATADLLILSESGKIELGTTPVVLTNIYYLLTAHNSTDIATAFLLKLTRHIKFIPISEKDYISALKSTFKDKEDAINYFAAISASCAMIVTRNKSDFSQATIPVLTAEEYLHSVWKEEE